MNAADFDQRGGDGCRALRDSCTPTNPREPDARALTELYRRARAAISLNATDNKNWRPLPYGKLQFNTARKSAG